MYNIIKVNKILLVLIILWLGILSSCGSAPKETWKGAYYDWWTEDSDIVYSRVFNNYKSCKDWAISKKSIAYRNYVYCSKNCKGSLWNTPTCEDVVRSWQPTSISKTFDNYRK